VSQDVLGFGIVGCGTISRWHANALSEIPDARLIGVYDVIPERADAIASEFGARSLASLDELLSRDDIDVVCVTTPSGLHAEVGIKAALAGKHVVVEKPIDVSLEKADRLISACSDAGVLLSVISQHRFDDGLQELHELINDGRLGRLLVGTASTKWYRSQEYYDSAEWRGTWELDGGGSLMNQGVHYVDLLLWLMGPVASLVAQTDTLCHDIEVEDNATALVRFASGAAGTVHASTVMYPGMSERLEISGTEGTVAIDDGRIVLKEFRDEEHELFGFGDAAPSTSAASSPTAISFEGHRRQLVDMIAAIKQGSPLRSSGADGRRALAFILAVYASGKTRTPVEPAGD
jgi:predicted dehydrogenase